METLHGYLLQGLQFNFTDRGVQEGDRYFAEGDTADRGQLSNKHGESFSSWCLKRRACQLGADCKVV